MKKIIDSYSIFTSMKKNTLIIFIVIVAALILGLVFVFGNSDANQNITLQASSEQTSYNSGEEVNLSINLTNSGEAAVCLAEGAIGNIKIVSATRDGETLETRSTVSYFLTSFSEILKTRLISVSPGGNLEFNLTSTLDPGLGAQALEITIPDDTSGDVTFYNIAEAGQYEIELVYEYVAGVSDSCPDILRDTTNTATVTFTIE